MAPGNKPTKPLSRCATAANRASTLKNSAKSPLLRLPAEIRNRIYGHVLGGYTVHILVEASGYSGGAHRVSHSICKLLEDDNDKYPRCRRSGSGFTEYDARHRFAGCATYRPIRKPIVLPLALLRTCRQLHGETALLPYAMNTFAFIGARQFHEFTGDLLAAQRRAMRSIVIWSMGTNELLYLDRLRKLDSLAELTIHAVLRYEYGRRGTFERNGGMFCDGIIERLRNLSLEKANLHLVLRYRLKDSELV